MTDISGIKRKSRLAVFEHVPEKKKNIQKRSFRPNRLQHLEEDDSSASESELVIEEDVDKPARRKRPPLIKYEEEPLDLHCEWSQCSSSFTSWSEYNSHIMGHASTDVSDCEWIKCGVQIATTSLLMQHLSYHGYLNRLKNVGDNILKRSKLPGCKNVPINKNIPLLENGYLCQWEYCSMRFYNIHDFFYHMKVHIKNNPRVANETINDIITCCWKHCNLKFSSQYKLDEHLRVHTKEKKVACPSCCALFTNRTKFVDHRKRQLPNDLKSYQCSQCLKLFPGERLLRDHIRSHINHYKCTLCDMTCLTPSTLAQHIRFKHIDDKHFRCNQCDKIFVTRNNLNTHIKTHTKNNEMKCDICDFSCRTKVGLETHYIRKHNQPKNIYECHCCKKQLRRGSYLTKHLMKMHDYHWPSGHSRFKYRKDHDGIYRLQTVRYESLEVTKEMIRSESMQTNSTKHVDTSWPVSEKTMDKHDNNIMITINDLDDEGNIIRSEVVISPEVMETVDQDDPLASSDCEEDFVGEKSHLTEVEKDFKVDIEYTELKPLEYENEKCQEKQDNGILQFKFFKDGLN